MLRSLLRLMTRSTKQPTPAPDVASQITLYAHVDIPPAPAPTPPRIQPRKKALRPSVSVTTSHRERLLSMRLEHTKICSPKRCSRLRQLGIVTAGDMACASPEQLAQHFGAPKKATRILKQYRRAIRFAASVPGMMPRDAMLLISIHRRSAGGLATESAASLHRDLERFAESSKGMSQLRGRRIPSARRLKRWIHECESFATRSPLKAHAV